MREHSHSTSCTASSSVPEMRLSSCPTCTQQRYRRQFHRQRSDTTDAQRVAAGCQLLQWPFRAVEPLPNELWTGGKLAWPTPAV
jgi:hypothetical protein